MSKFIIQGKAKLQGEIAVRGAKNMALKMIPAALLSDEPTRLTNLPNIEDIDRSLEIVADLGAKVEKSGNTCTIDPSGVNKAEISPDLAKKLRASIMFAAPLLAKFGKVKFPHPGGCVIGAGSRPIDLFLDSFQAMGAKINHDQGAYTIEADPLKGADYFFTTQSVTGTESLILAAALAEGKTVIKNAAMEPEITAMADYLNSVGAKITGAGTPTIVIEGVDKIKGGECAIIPDRIEAGTFAIMAAATKSELTITDCRINDIESLLAIFKKIKVPFEASGNTLTIKPAAAILSQSIKTHEYPGFPTDLQSPYTVLMTQADGSAIIHETIYDRRLLFTDMLTQMGANIIMCDPHRAVVNGPTPLAGKRLTSPDLRAGIAMVIAGMIAEDETIIDNIYQIDRGYENIDERLKAVGADIKRID